MENTVQPDQEVENTANLKDNESIQAETETASEQSKPEADNAQKKLQDELAEAKDKYLRLYSEFDNFRKRTAKEKI